MEQLSDVSSGGILGGLGQFCRKKGWSQFTGLILTAPFDYDFKHFIELA